MLSLFGTGDPHKSRILHQQEGWQRRDAKQDKKAPEEYHWVDVRELEKWIYISVYRAVSSCRGIIRGTG